MATLYRHKTNKRIYTLEFITQPVGKIGVEASVYGDILPQNHPEKELFFYGSPEIVIEQYFEKVSEI